VVGVRGVNVFVWGVVGEGGGGGGYLDKVEGGSNLEIGSQSLHVCSC